MSEDELFAESYDPVRPEFKNESVDPEFREVLPAPRNKPRTKTATPISGNVPACPIPARSTPSRTRESMRRMLRQTLGFEPDRRHGHRSKLRKQNQISHLRELFNEGLPLPDPTTGMVATDDVEEFCTLLFNLMSTGKTFNKAAKLLDAVETWLRAPHGDDADRALEASLMSIAKLGAKHNPKSQHPKGFAWQLARQLPKIRETQLAQARNTENNETRIGGLEHAFKTLRTTYGIPPDILSVQATSHLDYSAVRDLRESWLLGDHPKLDDLALQHPYLLGQLLKDLIAIEAERLQPKLSNLLGASPFDAYAAQAADAYVKQGPMPHLLELVANVASAPVPENRALELSAEVLAEALAPIVAVDSNDAVEHTAIAVGLAALLRKAGVPGLGDPAENLAQGPIWEDPRPSPPDLSNPIYRENDDYAGLRQGLSKKLTEDFPKAKQTLERHEKSAYVGWFNKNIAPFLTSVGGAFQALAQTNAYLYLPENTHLHMEISEDHEGKPNGDYAEDYLVANRLVDRIEDCVAYRLLPSTPGAHTIILFRGTAFGQDALATQEGYPLGLAADFDTTAVGARSFEANRETLVHWALERILTGGPVTISGHSLGGAMSYHLMAALGEAVEAQLTALRKASATCTNDALKKQLENRIFRIEGAWQQSRVIVFQSAGVNRATAKAINPEQCLRFETAGDVITKAGEHPRGGEIVVPAPVREAHRVHGAQPLVEAEFERRGAPMRGFLGDASAREHQVRQTGGKVLRETTKRFRKGFGKTGVVQRAMKPKRTPDPERKKK